MSTFTLSVGRCEAVYQTLARWVSIERSLYRQSGRRGGGEPRGKVVDPVSVRVGVVGDGCLPLGMRPRSCGPGWKEEAGQHIVQLRALALSDRWSPVLERALLPLRRLVRTAS